MSFQPNRKNRTLIMTGSHLLPDNNRDWVDITLMYNVMNTFLRVVSNNRGFIIQLIKSMLPYRREHNSIEALCDGYNFNGVHIREDKLIYTDLL